MSDFDMKMDLSDLSLDDIASWPIVVRAACITLCCALIIFLAYFVDYKKQLATVDRLHVAEKKLKQTFESKQQLAVSLKEYQAQLEQIQKTLGALLRQLPNQTEVPGLLEDISSMGHANGLKFSLFKPLPEKQHDFYAQLPIKIQMKGKYHQLAQFVSDVATLDRIVTLDDFNIVNEASNSKFRKSGDQENVDLMIDLTAHTYRYVAKGQS